MEPSIFGTRFFEFCNSNKKSNPIKIFISSSSCWHYFCLVEVDSDVAPLPFEFGQLEF
ncbi:hypothetical protein AHAS_Ahas16G0206200 [Arachis hypogaea]